MNPPVAALPPIAPQVRTLLETLALCLGIGNLCSLRWDRTGAGEFDLVCGEPDQWTAERIYGRLGRFSAQCPNPPVPIVNPYLQYEVHGADLTLNAACVLPGMADRLVPAKQAVGAGAQPVGAIGLMTVFSVLSLVWTLLHSRLTLNLPGSMEVDLLLSDPGTLVVDFKTSPTITVVFGLQLTASPSRLVLQEHSARIDYKAGWFAQSREWNW